jgi:hypothetical protein
MLKKFKPVGLVQLLSNTFSVVNFFSFPYGVAAGYDEFAFQAIIILTG